MRFATRPTLLMRRVTAKVRALLQERQDRCKGSSTPPGWTCSWWWGRVASHAPPFLLAALSARDGPLPAHRTLLLSGRALSAISHQRVLPHWQHTRGVARPSESAVPTACEAPATRTWPRPCRWRAGPTSWCPGQCAGWAPPSSTPPGCFSCRLPVPDRIFCYVCLSGRFRGRRLRGQW